MEKGDIIIIVGFVVLLVLFLWYVFGKSPTLEQIILGMIFVNIGLSVKNHGAISKIQGKFEEFKIRFAEHLGKHK